MALKNQWGLWAAALMVITGCAALDRVSSHTPWRCDPRADAAVEAGDFQQGLVAHQQLVANDPTNCLAIFHLGYIWGRLGERDKEIEFYQQAVACGYDDDDRLFFNLGMAYAALDQVDAARMALKKAVALGPDHADNFFGLGLVARQAVSWDEAVEALQKAIDLDPAHLEARVELIKISLDLSRWVLARDQLKALEKAAPEHGELPALWQTLRRRWVDE